MGKIVLMKKINYFLILLIITVSTSYSGNTVVGGRYSTISLDPLAEQVNPLLAIAEFKFTAQVQTVGEAVDLVLRQTGYEIISDQNQSNNVRLTLKKPLPVTVRSLGPIKISDALEVLMGQNVFQLVEDPLNRKVNFKLRKEFISKIGANNAFRKS